MLSSGLCRWCEPPAESGLGCFWQERVSACFLRWCFPVVPLLLSGKGAEGNVVAQTWLPQGEVAVSSGLSWRFDVGRLSPGWGA